MNLYFNSLIDALTDLMIYPNNDVIEYETHLTVWFAMSHPIWQYEFVIVSQIEGLAT